jgi:phosphatidylserine/phosphatidylglycerophosphate/cardiolipin synthase-like enzyme
VTQALLDAEKRGVQVRLVTDIDTLDDRTQNGAFAALQAAGIVVVGGNPKGIMHDKFAVVDGAAVWTGSWNFTTNDAYRYNNNAIIVRSAMLAQRYTLAFNRMFVEQRFGAAKTPAGAALRFSTGGVGVESHFSMEDKPVEAIIARVQQARSSIHFLAYTFTHDGIGQAVRAAAQRGVAVHGVFESNGAREPAGEWSPMKAMALDVRLDGNRYLMHHKVFVIDETTVIMGSFNFTENAEHDNDENMLIIDDAVLAHAYIAEFQKVYAQSSQ